MIATDIEHSDLGSLGTEIGRGGQAHVLTLPALALPDAPGPLVYKRYKKGQAGSFGLSSIVALRHDLSPGDRAELDACTVWPLRVVRASAEVTGVVLPLIGEDYLQSRRLPSGREDRAPREVQNLFVDPDLAVRLGMPLVPLLRRLAICRDLARALALLHRLGVVFGDINAKNVLFRVAASSTVMLVDCDAVRVRGSSAVVRQLNAPDWEPPEGDVLSQATDTYKFGLFVLRTLTPGPQCSVSRDPVRASPLLDASGRVLLDLALSTRAADRPSASQWSAYLDERLSGVAATLVRNVV